MMMTTKAYNRPTSSV